jgi:hypothetical protein
MGPSAHELTYFREYQSRFIEEWCFCIEAILFVTSKCIEVIDVSQDKQKPLSTGNLYNFSLNPLQILNDCLPLCEFLVNFA